MSKLVMIEPTELAPGLAGTALKIKTKEDMSIIKGPSMITLDFDLSFKGSPSVDFVVSLSENLTKEAVLLNGYKIQDGKIKMNLINLGQSAVNLEEDSEVANVKIVELVTYRQATKRELPMSEAPESKEEKPAPKKRKGRPRKKKTEE